MFSRLATRLIDILHSFWFLPTLMVVLAVLLAEATIALDESLGVRDAGNLMLFRGGVEGARALLGGIATSTFAVAGTVFSITIAALSIASTQMGPRLLESFTRDWRNSFSLGTLVATASYTFMILRVVRGSGGEPGFVPHLGVSLALGLTLLSIGVLIFFIHHVSASINVEYIIRLVHDDLHRTLVQQTHPGEGRDGPPAPPPEWPVQEAWSAPRSGYLQSVDVCALTRLAEQHDGAVRFLVRPGDFVMEDVPIALVTPQMFPGADRTLTIGRSRTTHQDVEYAVRKLVEVASRALSPSLNDPNTAMTVLDHLGNALCFLHDRTLDNGQYERNGQVRLSMPMPRFEGLVETMFNLIRQYGKTHPAVMIRMIEVLTQAAACLPDPQRQNVLRTHAALARHEAAKHTEAQHDLDAIERRYARFLHVCQQMQESSGQQRLPIELHE